MNKTVQNEHEDLELQGGRGHYVLHHAGGVNDFGDRTSTHPNGHASSAREKEFLNGMLNELERFPRPFLRDN